MILSFPADIKLTKDCLPPLPSPSSLLTQNKKLKSDLFTTKSSPFSYVSQSLLHFAISHCQACFSSFPARNSERAGRSTSGKGVAEERMVLLELMTPTTCWPT